MRHWNFLKKGGQIVIDPDRPKPTPRTSAPAAPPLADNSATASSECPSCASPDRAARWEIAVDFPVSPRSVSRACENDWHDTAEAEPQRDGLTVAVAKAIRASFVANHDERREILSWENYLPEARAALDIALPEYEAAHMYMAKQLKIMRQEKEHGWREAEKFETRLERAQDEIARLRAIDTVDVAVRLAHYHAARGITLPYAGMPLNEAVSDQATYVHGECKELLDAVDAWLAGPASFDGDPHDIDAHTLRAIRLEIADVVLACAVLADQIDTTVEACIDEKMEADRGRG